MSFDVGVMLIFGGIGYLFRKFEYEGAPLMLGFVLGPLLEKNLRQSLILSKGSFLIFFTRPISASGYRHLDPPSYFLIRFYFAEEKKRG